MATIILKVTEECNSYCYYCDVMRKPGLKTSMPDSVLDKVFFRINEYLEENQQEDINIIWHGGEPFVLDVSYYDAAIGMQESHCSTTANRITHSMQTNLTKFDEKYLPVLKKLGITALGTSYDPEPGVRGIGKKINTNLYNKKFMRALSVLENHGIGWGLIYVVTKKSLNRPLDVFHFLCNLTQSGGFNMNPVLIYDKDRQDIAITPVEYAEFLGALFPTWWEHKSRYPGVEPFKGFIDNIIDGNTNLDCVDSGDCAFNHINIAPDGKTSQCGRSADWGLLDYGSIEDKKLSEILADKQRHQLYDRNKILQKTDCKGCHYWALCHGGCPLDAYSKHNSFDRKTEWCDWKGIFFEKYFEPVTGHNYKSDLAVGA